MTSLPPVMSQEFFKKYFLVNFSDAQGLKPLLFVMLCIDAQAAVWYVHCWLAAFWAKDFLHIGFCNSIRQIYSEIDSMIGYLS